MPIIHDDEFGKITVRRNARSTQIRVRVTSDGVLSASLPRYAPLFLVKRLIKNSRAELRRLLDQARPKYKFYSGMQIGKSHILEIEVDDNHIFSINRKQTKILIKTPSSQDITIPENNIKIREFIELTLRREAKSYLPPRLNNLADKHGFVFNRIRFSHASSRWGSYSSAGTISLNIALMKLPFELIDYVLIHELAHTREMNHSRDFWDIVQSIDPDYQKHRRDLKHNNPSI